ncbi:MAG: polysaccharide pyruvyl transferase family protein [Candidatus Peribacteraceae bacterium]|nr:polysaccharide pyruvyl transferase family protein [Candidatus Peribacteraceae bacterium]
MRIFLTGQTTLHWGRMEYGNIGNYYIIEPFVRELHKTFTDCDIYTTLQMSDGFCSKEKITRLPIELYYSWNNDNYLNETIHELGLASIYNKTGKLFYETEYIKEVLKSDLVIDFSGDLWGSNADIIGNNRFLVGLIKDRVAQLLGKKTVMFAGSPGPFKDDGIKEFAKETYANFELVTNREPLSTRLLEANGFDISRTKSLACPSFLFESVAGEKKVQLLKGEGLDTDKPKVCFILCGWNFIDGPFDKTDRNDNEFTQFAEAIEFVSENLGADIYLMSHSNGFPIYPEEFKLLHGRDYYTIKQLQRLIQRRGIATKLHLLDGVYDAWETKAILGNFEMLISGRIHGCVGGLSQNIPTVIIDYGHAPKAHKITGFATVVGNEEYIANPAVNRDIINKIKKCWLNRFEYRKFLETKIPEVKKLAHENFAYLKKITIGNN